MLAQVDMTWWTVGWAVGAAVVVVVVLLVGAILALAAAVRGRAREITAALARVEDATAPLRRLGAVRGAASDIVHDLRAAQASEHAGKGPEEGAPASEPAGQTTGERGGQGLRAPGPAAERGTRGPERTRGER